MVKSVTIDKLPVTDTINDSDLLIVRSKEDGVTRQITKLQLFGELTEDVGDVLENYGTRSIVPNLDKTYDLGAVDLKWRDLYIDGTLFAGNIVGQLDSTITFDSGYFRSIIDSDFFLSLTASVFDGIVFRLDADSDRLSASLEDITQLSLDLSALDSDFNGYQIATANALSNLSVCLYLDSSRLTSLASDVVSLNTQVSNLDLLAFDSDAVASMIDSAVSRARTELISLIDLTDSSVNILAQRTTDLEADALLLDSAIGVNATALSQLTAQIILTDSAISVVSSDVSQLQSSLAGLDLVDSSAILAIVDSAVAAAETRIVARIDVTDSAITVLAERVDSLSSSLILLDSSLTLNATAINTLGTRVTATESDYSVLSQDLVELSQTVNGLVIDGINSDLVITVINEQTAGLIGRIDANSDELVSLSSDFTLLENNVVLKDSFNTILLAANAYNSLDTRIVANSDGVSTLTQRVTSLENKTYLDSSTLITAVAYQNLVSSIEANDSDILVNSGLITDLQNSIGFDSDALVSSTAYQALTSRIEANDSDILVNSGLITDLQNSIGFDSDALVSSTAYQALTSKINAVDDSVTAQASLITNLAVSIQNLEDSVTNTASLASGFDVRISATESDLTDIAAEYFLTTNVNGYISGIKLYNTGVTSEFTVVTDKFNVINASNTAIQPFTISGDSVELSNVRVTGDLMVDGTITTNKLTFNADGANLVTDVASFENYAAKGFVYGTTGNSTHTITNEIPAVHGTHVLKLNSTAADGFKYIHPSTDTAGSWIRAEVGEQYIVSGYVRTKDTDTVPVRLVAVAREFGATSGGAFYPATRDITASDGWVRISTLTSAISGTDPAFAIYLINANSGDSSYWDAIQIEKYDGLHTSPSPFKLAGTTTIDGSSITTGTISADRLNVNDIISSGSIIVSGNNISLLTNNAGYVDGSYVTSATADFITADDVDGALSTITTTVINNSGIAVTSDIVGLISSDSVGTLISDFITADDVDGALTTLNQTVIDNAGIAVTSQLAGFVTGDSVDDYVSNPPNFNLNKTTTNVGKTTITGDGILIQSWNGSSFVDRVKLGNLSVL